MTFAIIANPQKYSVKEAFETILRWTEEHETPVYVDRALIAMLDNGIEEQSTYLHIAESEQQAVDQADIIIALGGDGTMLYTARLTKNTRKPIFGVNSGRLGFMANTQPEEVADALNDIQNGNYRLDRRHMLEARTSDGQTYHALNEFLFSKKDSASMITILAEYNEMPINKYWADGLIVATPTGSTAYNLSSSGPIVMPDTEVMVVTPINPHTLTTRPLVLPSDRPLKITIDKQEHDVLFSYDGKIYEIQTYPFEVEIRRSNFTVDIIELPHQNYFETLRNKLMWGLDFRKRL
ncbi:MAG: NAD(+)/NADH kinase [Bacteroidota bacterium]